MTRNHFSILIVLSAFAAGCGRGAGDDGFQGERGQVSGTITLDGQPLKSGCQIIFMSAKGGHTAGGVVKDGGAYALEYKVKAGIPVGDYLVQLSAPLAAPSTETVDPSKMAEKMKLDANSSESDEGPFPSKYSSTASSGLKYTVKSGANTAADFKLEKK